MKSNEIKWITKKKKGSYRALGKKDLVLSVNKAGKNKDGSQRYAVRIALWNEARDLFDYLKICVDAEHDNYTSACYLEKVQNDYNLKREEDGVYSVDLIRR